MGMGIELKVIAISKWQGVIDWEKVKKDEIAFAFSRLGEGGTYVDEKFKDNFYNSKAAGISAGAWHIYRATSSTPQAQANNIIENLVKVGFNKSQGFALEVFRGELETEKNYGIDRETMAENLVALIELILNNKQSNISPDWLFIKTDINTWNNYVDWQKHSDLFRGLNLWVKQWQINQQPVKPTVLEPWGEYGWTYWEYSAKGQAAGIGGNVLLSQTSAPTGL